MAKCKACGGSGKIEEKKDSKVPKAPDDSKYEQNIARKQKERTSTRKPKERISPYLRKDDTHEKNIGSKPKNYKPIKGYRTKAK